MIATIVLLSILCAGLTTTLIHRNRQYKSLKDKTRPDTVHALDIDANDIKQFFTNSLDMLCIADTQGYFRLLNPEWEQTLGYPMDTLIGKQFMDLVHPDDKEKTLQTISQLKNNQNVISFENRYRHNDGTYRWIEWRSFPSGNMIYAAARNVTDRKNAEEALQKSEQRYRLLFENMTSGFALHQMIYDENGKPADYRYIEANPAFGKLTGLPANTIIGKTIKELIPSIEDYWIDTFGQVALSGVPMYYMNYAKDLGKYYDTYVFSPEKDKYAVVFNDATDRMNAEKALKENEARFRSMVDNMPMALGMADLNGNIFFINKTFVEYFGYELEEVSTIEKWSLQAYPDKAYREEVQRLWEKDIIDVLHFRSTYSVPRVYSMRAKSGQSLYVEINFTIIDNQLYALFNNVTEKTKAVNELRASEQNFQNIFHLSPDMVGITRLATGEVLAGNSALTQLTGFYPDEYLGKTTKELGWWANYEDRENMLKMMHEKNEVKNMELKMRIKDGTILTCLFSCNQVTFNNEACLIFVVHDITERKQFEEAMSKRVIALTKPLDDAESISFDDLFNIDELQKIQDTFANATGVASIITDPDGSPITQPSNFCRLCNLIRETKKGRANCFKSDSCLGKQNLEGPTIQPCLSGGLWDAGASITIGGKHLANWLIGQVRNKAQDESVMLDYADEIGADKEEFRSALHEAAIMPQEQFEKVSQSLFVLANQLSVKAYQNIQQARFIAEQKKAEEALKKSEEQLSGIAQNIPGMVFQLFAKKDGRVGFNYLSDLYIKYLGIENKPIDEILDLMAAGIVEDDRPSFISSIQAAIATQTTWEWEGRYIRPDGQKIFFRGISHPRLIDNELFFDGIVLDITEQKQTLEALIDSERNYRDVFNASSDALFIHEMPGGIVVDVNEAMVKIYGFANRDEALRAGMKTYCIESKPYTVQDAQEKLRLADEVGPQTFEWRVRHHGSQELIWVEVSLIKSDIGGKSRIIASVRDITERRNAELALKKSESVLKATMESMSDGLLIVAADGGITHFNTRFKEIFSFPDEIWATNDEKVMLDFAVHQVADPDAFVKKVNEIYQTNDNTEDIILFANGNIIERYSFPLPEDSPVKGRVWLFRDITERKKAEDALLKSQSWLRDSQRVAHIGSWEYYYKDNKLVWNDEAYVIYGYNTPDVQPTIETFIQLVCPEDRSMVKAHLDRSIQTKEFNEFECRIIRSDGEVRDIRVVGDLSDDEDGETYRSFGIVQDITERKQAEEDLRRSRERFAKSFDSSPAAMVISEIATGLIIDANKSYLDMMGYTRNELIGRLAADLDIWVDEDTRNEITKQIKTYGSVTEREVQMHTQTGQILDIIWSGVSINIDGQPVMLSFNNNITQRKEAERVIKNLNLALEEKVVERTEQLQQANHDLESFAYSVSHDLRAPIRHVDGFVNLMYANIPNPAANVTGYFNKINIATHRMSNMIDELLAFSRLGRKELSLSPVNMNELMAEIIDQFRPDTEQRNIQWNVSPLPTLPADRNLLKMAFENLVSNAIKYTSKKAAATIEIGSNSAENDQVDIYIKDNGAGFDMAYSNKLFGVFQRLHSPDEFEGTGIGLANVKQIITKHKGRITATAQINEGATFVVTLPLHISLT